MTIERTLETQRLRLLRLVTGLLAIVVFVSASPFSHTFSRWVSEGVSSILSKAETAAQYLVIVQARLIAGKTSSSVDRERLREVGLRNKAGAETSASLRDLRGRLSALRAVLVDLPRYGLRLLRRTEKSGRRLLRAARTHHATPIPDIVCGVALGDLRLVGVRIERPPDKGFSNFGLILPPPVYGREAEAV